MGPVPPLRIRADKRETEDFLKLRQLLLSVKCCAVWIASIIVHMVGHCTIAWNVTFGVFRGHAKAGHTTLDVHHPQSYDIWLWY